MTFLLDETDCSGEFLRYFARLHVTCNHTYVIRSAVTLGCRYVVTVYVLTEETILHLYEIEIKPKVLLSGSQPTLSNNTHFLFRLHVCVFKSISHILPISLICG